MRIWEGKSDELRFYYLCDFHSTEIQPRSQGLFPILSAGPRTQDKEKAPGTRLHRNTDREVFHSSFLSRTFSVSSRRSNSAPSADFYPTTTIECSVILRDLFMLTISSTAALLYLNLNNSSVM